MVRRSITGAMLCALATIFLALAHSPPAAAKDRRVAKFDVLLSGTIATTRDVIGDPSNGLFGKCAYTETERISFRNAKRTTAYAFVGRYGRAVFTTWSSVPNPEGGGLREQNRDSGRNDGVAFDDLRGPEHGGLQQRPAGELHGEEDLPHNVARRGLPGR